MSPVGCSAQERLAAGQDTPLWDTAESRPLQAEEVLKEEEEAGVGGWVAARQTEKGGSEQVWADAAAGQRSRQGGVKKRWVWPVVRVHFVSVSCMLGRGAPACIAQCMPALACQLL